MTGVMIVDDDQSVRERLKAAIAWEALELSMVCEAGDSDTARELFIFWRPKIVIMDINIPIISGIELARELAEIDKEVRFIIITGHGNFEHVKNSVRLGAVDLISKPVMPEEINQNLRAVVDHFRLVREQQASSALMTELLNESRPMLIQQALSALLMSRQEDLASPQLHRLEKLGFNLEGRHCAVVIISTEPGDDSVLDFDLTLVATKNITEELFHDAGLECYGYYDDASNLICVVHWDEDIGEDTLEKAVRLIHEKMAFYFDIRLIAGIGRAVTSYAKLPQSYRDAKIAFHNKGVLDDETIVIFRDLRQMDTPVVSDTDRLYKDLSLLFKGNRMQEIAKVIGDYCTMLSGCPEDGLEKAREFAFAYITRVMSDSITLGLGPVATNRLADDLIRLSSLGNIQSIAANLIGITEELLRALFQKRAEVRNQLIQVAKTYISEHLSDDQLNLELVSSHVGLSSAYFSKLFHREAGISFNDHLNLTRIQKSKELLTNTVMKVYEVGEAVGYSNTKYFNYVFKRLTGLTPLEYKNS